MVLRPRSPFSFDQTYNICPKLGVTTLFKLIMQKYAAIRLPINVIRGGKPKFIITLLLICYLMSRCRSWIFINELKKVISARLSPSPFVALIYFTYKTKEILNIRIILFSVWKNIFIYRNYCKKTGGTRGIFTLILLIFYNLYKYDIPTNADNLFLHRNFQCCIFKKRPRK